MNYAETVLRLNGLTKFYGKIRGIENLDLSVGRGEIFGFIGPNGAGKSTAIRTIMGLLKPDDGSIEIFGENVSNCSDEIRSRIGFMPSELNYYEGLSVRELMKYSAGFYGKNAANRIDAYCSRFKLQQKRKIRDLSLGNRKKVGFIQALLHEPDLLILDEPTSGLDPLMQSVFYETICEEQARGATVFFSSHTLPEVERLCSRVAIIRDGRIISSSGMDELKKISMKRISVVFDSDYRLEPSKFTEIEQLKISGSRLEGYFRGNISGFLKRVTAMPINDIVIEDPGLEEIFMHYYRGKE